MLSKLTIGQYLEELQDRQRRQAALKQAGAPEVGIFWFIQASGEKPKLVGDGTPLPEAEDYGNFKTHPRDHYSMWNALRRHLGNPFGIDEYEDWPRGRIVYDSTRALFVVYADRQLLNDTAKREILNYFRLPPKVTFSTDAHYSQAAHKVSF